MKLTVDQADNLADWVVITAIFLTALVVFGGYIAEDLLYIWVFLR